MKKLPTLLTGLFLTITLSRVAALAGGLGAGPLGWMFAAGLGAGVYTASYWRRTSDSKLRASANTTLMFFIIADGAFNAADVWQTLQARGVMAGLHPIDPVLALAGALYALFPTFAAALLGSLQGHVDRQPSPATRASIGGVWRAAWRVIISRIEARAAPDAPLTRQVASTATDAPALTPADAPTAPPDAPESDKARHARHAREYAAANGVSLRTAQRRLAEMAEQVTP